MGLTISKEQVAEMPLETFEGDIVVIDHVKEVGEACDYLSSRNALGFDTETKPAFKRGQVHKVALIQLSTEKECFLFRLNILFPALLLCSRIFLLLFLYIAGSLKPAAIF